MSNREYHSCRIFSNEWTAEGRAISNIVHGSVGAALEEGLDDAESEVAFRESYTVVEYVDGHYVRVPDETVDELKRVMLA